VRDAMAGFPGASLHKGWIPEVLAELPEAPWSFVHVDVDLYQPTLDCLKYFFPRLVPGGVIVCDDYGSPAFPGARRAWIEFCGDSLGYVALPTGQSVLVKP
jgi:O-methyltransferase